MASLLKLFLDMYPTSFFSLYGTGNLFVTPKEVDAVVDRLANIIANSINIALHPGITLEDINKYAW